MKRWVIFLIAATLGLPLFANESEDRLHRPWIFLGVDAGYARLNTGVATEFDKNGYQLNAKGLGSYYGSRWVVDGGFGWGFQYLTGAEPPVASESITTRSILMELAGRYRLSSRWQIGPLSRSVFGTDLKFGSHTDTTSLGQFAGLQGVYEIPFPSLLIRLTAQALTDLNIANRQLYVVELGFQTGFSPLRKASISSEQTHSVRLNLEGDTFYFDFAKSSLNPDAEKYLRSMGKYLSDCLNLWESLKIEGHTDERGSDAYNLTLSKARADSVKAAIAAGGANEARITTEGFSFHRPRVHGKAEAAHRQNRRVELKFSGVSDKTSFEGGLQRLKKSP